jgi:hypothetical protein
MRRLTLRHALTFFYTAMSLSLRVIGDCETDVAASSQQRVAFVGIERLKLGMRSLHCVQLCRRRHRFTDRLSKTIVPPL